jgi:hypothetical protein
MVQNFKTQSITSLLDLAIILIAKNLKWLARPSEMIKVNWDAVINISKKMISVRIITRNKEGYVFSFYVLHKTIHG